MHLSRALFIYERADNAHALLVRRNKIYLPSNAKETNFFNNQVLKGGKRGVHNTSHIYTFVNEYQELKARAELNSKLLQSALLRIHSHLAYKLGSAMILNSKSLWGYIRMPYVLSFIKETHRKEIADYEARVAKNPSLKLPPLESYTDYKQALKEKECFTYKLGKALITTNSVRGGGESLLICNFFKKCVS